MDTEQREFRADALKLKRLRVAAGMTVADFAKSTGLDRTTAGKILRGQPVFLKSLAIAGKEAFGIDNPMDLLHPDELSAMGMLPNENKPGHVLEWEVVEYLSEWEKTANGLQYQLAKLRHRYLDRLARGKCYELRHLPSAEKQQLEEHLRRHADVCERIGPHPNIASNLTAAWCGGYWWVIDRWEDGGTLNRRLAGEALSEYELKFIGSGVAEGLKALHAEGIIRRELSPKFILLRESSDRPVLTDFELAKLLESKPTVSPDEWPEDPYRAAEVTGDAAIDARADIYSWGRVFVHGACGELPERGSEPGALEKAHVPDSLKKLLSDCVRLPRSKRPKSIDHILRVLEDLT